MRERERYSTPWEFQGDKFPLPFIPSPQIPLTISFR